MKNLNLDYLKGMDIDYSKIGTKIEVIIDDKNFKCEVIEKPFFDPKKLITSKSLK